MPDPNVLPDFIIYSDREKTSEYRDWMRANPEGYVLNWPRGGISESQRIVYHRGAGCKFLQTRAFPSTQWQKVCSTSEERLMDWARARPSSARDPRIHACKNCIDKDRSFSIGATDIWNGIKRFNEGHLHDFPDSTKYDLVVDGKRYPPEAVVGLASLSANGRVLSPSELSGGLDSTCFRTLESHGFRIEPKVDAFPPTADEESLEQSTADVFHCAHLPAPEGNASPVRVSTTSLVFERCPRVRAFVLRRARGACECCGKAAPFYLANGLPFLEVHHVEFLRDDGNDWVSNTVAICPNCHRECHYGVNREVLKEKLLNLLAELDSSGVNKADAPLMVKA